MKITNGIDLTTYIETPRRTTEPVKLDAILEARMKAFRRAKRVRNWMGTR